MWSYRTIKRPGMCFLCFTFPSAGSTDLHVTQATQIDTLVGSIANGLNSSGRFCTGSRIVMDHQCINSASFVFSVVVPAPLAISASEGVNPSPFAVVRLSLSQVSPRVSPPSVWVQFHGTQVGQPQ